MNRKWNPERTRERTVSRRKEIEDQKTGRGLREVEMQNFRRAVWPDCKPIEGNRRLCKYLTIEFNFKDMEYFQ